MKVFRLNSIAFLLGSLLVASACSEKEAEGGGDETPALGTSLKDVMSKSSTLLSEAVPRGAALAVSTKQRQAPNFSPSLMAAFTEAEFETSLNLGAISYFTTPASFVDYILETAADTNPEDGMGLINRFKQKVISGMCPIMAAFPDADGNGVPDVGSGSINIPDFNSATVQATFSAVCPGIDFTNLTGASNMAITYAVTDVSQEAGSLYDIKATLSLGGGANIFYYKADGNVIRFVFSEADSSDATADAEFAFFEYDKTNMRFEMYGGHQDGHYRMLYNPTSKDISLYAHISNDGSEDKRIYAAIVGNRANSVAAVTITGDATGNSHDSVTNAQACVELAGDTPAWSSAPESGKCGTIDVIDFATAPTVAAASLSYAGKVSNMAPTFQSLFTSRAEVFSKAIFE